MFYLTLSASSLFTPGHKESFLQPLLNYASWQAVPKVLFLGGQGRGEV